MIPAAENSSPGSEASNESRAVETYQDLALFLVALLILVTSSWWQPASRGEVVLEETAARPLRINVNSAPWYTWVLLEGIGEVRARNIVAFRAEEGPFRNVDDLERVPGMPAGWVEKARPYLWAGDESEPEVRDRF